MVARLDGFKHLKAEVKRCQMGSIEFELTGILEQTNIVEYNFDEAGVFLYWTDLEETNAKIDSTIILLAEQHIFENKSCFGEIILTCK